MKKPLRFMLAAEILAILFMGNNLPHNTNSELYTVMVILIMVNVLFSIVLSVFIFIDILKD